MSIRPIRRFPDRILRQKAQPVRTFDQNLVKLIQDLDDTMRHQPAGIGIAAPQIGIALRVALVDVSPRIKDKHRLVLVNPVILELAEDVISREGCMSMPDYTADLRRYRWIRFRAQNEYGRSYEMATVGLEAICVQHEVDHLEGKLFFDRVACLKTDMYPRRLRTRHSI